MLRRGDRRPRGEAEAGRARRLFFLWTTGVDTVGLAGGARGGDSGCFLRAASGRYTGFGMSASPGLVRATGFVPAASVSGRVPSRSFGMARTVTTRRTSPAFCCLRFLSKTPRARARAMRLSNEGSSSASSKSTPARLAANTKGATSSSPSANRSSTSSPATCRSSCCSTASMFAGGEAPSASPLCTCSFPTRLCSGGGMVGDLEAVKGEGVEIWLGARALDSVDTSSTVDLLSPRLCRGSGDTDDVSGDAAMLSPWGSTGSDPCDGRLHVSICPLGLGVGGSGTCSQPDAASSGSVEAAGGSSNGVGVAPFGTPANRRRPRNERCGFNEA